MDTLFRFEQEKCAALRRFPMHFRLKLDLCGIKLSKRDWNAFALSDKEALVAMPCESREQIDAFRSRLKTLIKACGGNSLEIDPIGELAPWKKTSAVPACVQNPIEGLCMNPLSPTQWLELTELQRFALVKLTCEGHVKKEIRQVLEEFDLTP